MHVQRMEEEQWTIAHDIASELVNNGTDPNELGKVIAFLRRHQNGHDAKDKLMLLVQRLANSHNALIRSQQTQRFYGNIQKACEKHLSGIYKTDELLYILGWSLRLMRYYRVEPKRAAEEQQRPKPVPQQREPRQQRPAPQPQQTRPARPVETQEKPKVKVGDKINATILKKEGFEVTVQLQTDSKEEIVFERPYYPGLIGAKIKVRVLAVSEGELVTKVTP